MDVIPWKLRVKPCDIPVLSAWGLLYLFSCLICIPCYITLNLRGLMPLFGLSLLTILEGLCHFCICSSDLFNEHLGLSSSSKSVMSFLLSSVFCSVSFSSSSGFSCSSLGISTSSGSNLALNWSAWANICCPSFLVQPCSVPFVEWTLLSLALPPYFFYTKLSPLWQMTWLLGL